MRGGAIASVSGPGCAGITKSPPAAAAVTAARPAIVVDMADDIDLSFAATTFESGDSERGSDDEAVDTIREASQQGTGARLAGSIETFDSADRPAIVGSVDEHGVSQTKTSPLVRAIYPNGSPATPTVAAPRAVERTRHGSFGSQPRPVSSTCFRSALHPLAITAPLLIS